MKAFDLEQARAGAPLVMRNGQRARVDVFGTMTSAPGYPAWTFPSRLKGVSYDPDGSEWETRWYLDGRFLSNGLDHEYDLFMAPTENGDA